MPMPPSLENIACGHRTNAWMSSSTIDVQTTEAPPSLTIWMKASTGVIFRDLATSRRAS